MRKIGRILDRKGEVRDDASPKLAALRRQVQGARERLYGRLEAIGGAHRELIGEETIPMRGGRLMLMVQAGNRGKLAGLVHGRSATGKSLYFEPLEVVEENNTLQGAVDELEGERQRLLYELLRDLAAETSAGAADGRTDRRARRARGGAPPGARDRRPSPGAGAVRAACGWSTRATRCSIRGSPAVASGCSVRAVTRARSSRWTSSSRPSGARW